MPSTVTTARVRHEAAHPQVPVHERVDVVDDRGQHVPALPAEPARHQRHERVVDRGTPLGEQAQRHVVGDQPLGVAQHRAGQAEGAHPDDRDHEHEHRRVLGGAGDQPAGRRGERHARRGRERPRSAPRASRPGAGRAPGGRRGTADAGGAAGAAAVPWRRPGQHLRGWRRPPVGPGTAGDLDHVVGHRDDRAVAVRDHDDHALSRARSRTGLGDHRLGQRVEVGGGLVEQHQRPLRHHRPGQRQPRPLAGRQPGAVLAEHLVEPVGQGGDDLAERDPLQGRPDLGVGGAGTTEEHVVARPGRRPARDAAGPRRPATPVRPLGVHGRRRRGGGRRRAAGPVSTARSVDLPHPEGPTTAVSPAGEGPVSPASTGSSRPG